MPSGKEAEAKELLKMCEITGLTVENTLDNIYDAGGGTHMGDCTL